MTVHPLRSTSDGRRKGVALGGLGVPEEHVVPQGLSCPFTVDPHGPGGPDMIDSACESRTLMSLRYVSVRLGDSVSRDLLD